MFGSSILGPSGQMTSSFTVISCRYTMKRMDLESKLELRPVQVQGGALLRVSPDG